jgi:CheY-like chemotaxis protein
MHVLMIDDELATIRDYVTALEEQGAEVRLCRTNEEALEALASDVVFDIIVEDIMRPPGELFDLETVQNGILTGVVFYERYIKKLQPNTPHVFLTVHSGHDLRDRYSDAPVSSFFNKMELRPFEFAEMVAGIVKRQLAVLYKQSNIPLTGYPVVQSVRDEVKRYFNRHPEKIHTLSPRAFEELVADILNDLGLDVELTKATRDGGVDIYAHLKHEIGAFLMLVECKKWASDRPVGIDVVQRVFGIQQTQHASKALIVTTSFFTPPAKSEATRHSGLIDLKDFKDLKQWLSKYK